MGKSKDLQLPATPTQDAKNYSGGDPILEQSKQGLYDYANQLISGDYSGFGGLQDAVSLHPQNTQLALNAASGFLQPQYQQSNLDIQNMAIANNQNTSSTFTDALAKNALTLNSQYQGIASGAALQDAQSARANQLGLFGQGLNTLQGAGQLGLSDQSETDQFNLSNYSNLVAKAIQDNQNANKANGWQQFGAMMSPIYHDYLGSQGINSVPGYGVADIAKIGGTFMGMGGGGFGGSPGFGGGIYGQATLPGFYAR